MLAEYGFLYALAFIWLLFAGIIDFKTTEVPNWLSYSLIAFAVAYRAFYSLAFNNANFFFYGFLGFIFFMLIAFALYYGGAFGGGDAKLLMGLGLVLPFSSIGSIFYLGIAFVVLLFSIGALYTLVYTFFLISGNKKFKHNFRKKIKSDRIKIFVPLIFGLILGVISFSNSLNYFAFLFVLLGLSPLIYIYVKEVDEACMIKLSDWRKLREGDWLVQDVKINGNLIRKSIHGLTEEDITLIKKYKKKVLIKSGLPFTFIFFITLMVFFVLASRFPYLFSYLP